VKIAYTATFSRDTEDFTEREWREFIKEWCEPEDIAKAYIGKNADLFPMDKLKRLAERRYMGAKVLDDEFGL
jgi:hypothetical protein